MSRKPGKDHIPPSTSHVAADEADPEVAGRLTVLAVVLRDDLGRLHVPADRAGGVLPLGQAAAVELVVAEDRQDGRHALIHPLQADRAVRQLAAAGGRVVLALLETTC